ncbi:MAG: hypothetical protein IJD67_06115 [Clostridia bacterium]|nr:hypothetical protein [Clostridia bacterium]
MKKRVFCLFFAILIVLAVSLVGCRDEDEEQQFVPPEFDKKAVTGTPDVAEGEKGYSLIDAGGVYKVGVCGEIKLVNGNADVWFTNDAGNDVWLKLRIQDKNTGEILGQTGLIKPGEYVKSINFSKSLSAGTDIVLRVMSYEPDTYYSKGEITLNITAS